MIKGRNLVHQVILLILIAILPIFQCSHQLSNSSMRHHLSVSFSGCGPGALAILCEKMGVKTSPKELAILAGADERGMTSMYGLAQAAQAKGFKATGYLVTLDELWTMPLPVIAHVKGNHFVVVLQSDEDGVTVVDNGRTHTLKENDFTRIWEGYILTIQR